MTPAVDGDGRRPGAHAERDGSELSDTETVSLKGAKRSVEGQVDTGPEEASGDRESDNAAAADVPGIHRRNDKCEAAGGEEMEGGGWYSVSPDRGVLLPGEKLELRFTVRVSEAEGLEGMGRGTYM